MPLKFLCQGKSKTFVAKFSGVDLGHEEVVISLFEDR